jgi:hypothetical protein
MARISPSYQYNLSTALAVGAGSMSRSMATTATFWLALVKARSYPPLVAGSRGRFLGLSPGACGGAPLGSSPSRARRASG